jgi:hypothetical protein
MPKMSQSPSLLEKRDKCIELYFEKFHSHWPFIHRASFYAPREVPLMVQSMIVIGLWASGEQTSQSAAKDLHNKIDAAIREQTVRFFHGNSVALISNADWIIGEMGRYGP